MIWKAAGLLVGAYYSHWLKRRERHEERVARNHALMRENARWN